MALQRSYPQLPPSTEPNLARAIRQAFDYIYQLQASGIGSAAVERVTTGGPGGAGSGGGGGGGAGDGGGGGILQKHGFGAGFTGLSGPIPVGAIVYFTIPYGGTVKGWVITVDTGVIILQIWRVPDGFPNPTYADRVTFAGLMSGSGFSTDLSQFMTLTFNANDKLAVYVSGGDGTTVQAHLLVEFE